MFSRRRPNLSGISEGLLWPLYNRAAHARQPDLSFDDPKSVALVESIDYPFERHFGRPNAVEFARTLAVDRLLVRWLVTHPRGTVVSLCEGLETRFWRVDNGSVRWLSLDGSAAIDTRARLLPSEARHRNLRCSPVDPGWRDEVDPRGGVFVDIGASCGRLEPFAVRRLLVSIAQRFPHAQLVLDVMPRVRTQDRRRPVVRGPMPLVPWGLDRHELEEICTWHPNLGMLHEVELVDAGGWMSSLWKIGGRRWSGRSDGCRPALVQVQCEPRLRTELAALSPGSSRLDADPQPVRGLRKSSRSGEPGSSWSSGSWAPSR
ncbi:MAG: class I SAM-dependent methyltransferase [Myxococcota bacterium]